MQEYSRSLGDTVRSARLRQGYTQKQIADKLDVDERSIASIEKYQANTTMEILYPLIRMLKIDAREIFNPEMSRESKAHYQLRLLVDSCTENEAEALAVVCNAFLSALQKKDATHV